MERKKRVVPREVCAVPVSYTHLDVYKRQALYREASEWWDFDESGDYIKIEKPKTRIEKIVQAAKRG